MNEKVCPQCGRQNPADMSFCLNCGQSLALSGSNFAPDSTPTVFAPTKATQPNFQPLAPNLPPPKKSKAGFWVAIVGGIGLIFVLLGIGIVGLVAMNWDKIAEEGNKNTYYPSPTPPANQNTGFNSTTPTPRENRNGRSTPTPNINNGTPSANFDRMWVDYNVTENGRTGMRIHVKFTANNMKDVDSYLAVYFETREGIRLKDKNRILYSADGDVAVYKVLKPGFDVTEYDDLTVFMPYDELELSKGDYKLRMSAYVIYKAGGAIQHLTYYDFDYSSYK